MSQPIHTGTPLARKLGIKPGALVSTFDAPEALAALLDPLPDQATLRPVDETEAGGEAIALALIFADDEHRLRHRFAQALDRLPPDGAIWLAWPKKASKVETNLDFDVVQQIGLYAGLVDNKVCAIDETWSGLRLVVPKDRRAAWPER